MRILITGGLGFVGRKLAIALDQAGQLRGQPISEIVLADVVPGALSGTNVPINSIALDVSDADAVMGTFRPGFDVIYHLAAIVSGAAEADFDLGLNINLNGTLNLLQAARAQGDCPVFIYASSCAVHGGNEPDPVPMNVELNPQTSYGTQKVIGELLLNDMSRKGFIDGVGLRLPTVTVRPGKPNAAASSFMSSIFREPLQGKTANCPVSKDYMVWHTAPRTLTENLVHAAEIGGKTMGYNRNINLSGRSDTIGEMIEAMIKVAGPKPATRITWNSDPAIEAICAGWRGAVAQDAAEALGYRKDQSFSDSINWFLTDDIEK